MSSERIADDVTALIGATPMVRLRRVGPHGGAELVAKLESFEPGGSVKDRAALAMVRDAEGRGLLRPGATLVEASSGNTGVSLAMVAAVRGYRCIIVMPEDMSLTRRHLMIRYGAEVVLTPPEEGMWGAVREAERIARETEGAFLPRQFDNPANPAVHAETTAEEIWRETGGRLDAIVAGVGTGGTLSGVASTLRERVTGLLVVAVEPARSAVLSGGRPGLHAIQGLGAGFVPGVLRRELLDEVVAVEDRDALAMADRLAREEGLLVGPSSGAAVWAAVQVARSLGPGRRVVTVLPDTGERYLS